MEDKNILEPWKGMSWENSTTKELSQIQHL